MIYFMGECKYILFKFDFMDKCVFNVEVKNVKWYENFKVFFIWLVDVKVFGYNICLF